MKRFLIFVLMLFVLFTNLNVERAKANTLASELVVPMAEYISLKGLIAAGVTIPTGAIVVGGVAAGTLLVREWAKANPDEYQVIKDSISSGINYTVNLADSTWSNMRSWVGTNFSNGNTTITFNADVGITSVPVEQLPSTGVNIHYDKVVGSFGSFTLVNIDNSTLYEYKDGVLTGSSLNLTNYYYKGMTTFADSLGRTRIAADCQSKYSSDHVYPAFSLCSSSTSAVGTSSFPINFTGESVVDNPTWDYVNPNNNVRSVVIPQDLVNSPSVDSIDLAKDSLDGKTFLDITTEKPPAEEEEPQQQIPFDFPNLPWFDSDNSNPPVGGDGLPVVGTVDDNSLDGGLSVYFPNKANYEDSVLGNISYSVDYILAILTFPFKVVFKFLGTLVNSIKGIFVSSGEMFVLMNQLFSFLPSPVSEMIVLTFAVVLISFVFSVFKR